MANPFFIVCSASSGSTLLSVLLDGHSEIACGPELAVFNKKNTYLPFDEFKVTLPELLEKGASTQGEVEYRGYFDNLEAYEWTKEALVEASQRHDNANTFFDEFFGRILEKRTKSVWGEKTGSNVYYMDQILSLFPEARIIHLIRNPYDSISSIVKRLPTNRGTIRNEYEAVSHWLMNNELACKWKESEQYLLVSYEQLVRKPDETLAEIQQHIGVKYEPLTQMASNSYWQDFQEKNVHNSWNSDPFSKLETKHIGLGVGNLTEWAFFLIDNLRLSNTAIRRFGGSNENIVNMVQGLGLDYELSRRSKINKLKAKFPIWTMELKRARREFLRDYTMYLPLFRV